MEPKSFIGKGILLSVVIAFLISGAQTEVSLQACSGPFALIGQLVCDPNAQCSEYDGSLGCYCNDGFEGDGWKVGIGCGHGGGAHAIRAKREQGWVPGMWDSNSQHSWKTCTGFASFLGDLFCAEETTCLYSPQLQTMKCQCPAGTHGLGLNSAITMGAANGGCSPK